MAFGTAGMLKYRYGWDNVSTRATGCNGPLLQADVVNGNPDTWYAHFKGKRGTWRRITMNPGDSGTVTQAQLTSAGFVDASDLENLYITRDPAPPVGG
jgi:hypothetical protein